MDSGDDIYGAYADDFLEDDSSNHESMGSDADADFDEGESDYQYFDDKKDEQNYTILKEEEIKKCQEADIKEVSTALSISKNSACILLRHFRWIVSKVYDEWFADEDRIRQAVGLLDNQTVKFSKYSRRNQTCGICFESHHRDKMKSAGCSHLYCSECWTSYISISINDGPGCLALRCPEPSCPAAVDQDLIDAIASDEDKKKYSRYLVRSYIEGNNKKMKWCPAPGCENAVKYVLDGSGSKYYDVLCHCSYGFCWNCTEENHRPVDCDTVSKWVLKNNADANNAKWMLAKTKPCPKCNRAIEKNNGCMHMTCSSPCKFQFCWLCLGDWKDHNNKTGGNYACNTYEYAKRHGKLKEEEEIRELANRSIERYNHYYERWVANNTSMEIATRDLQKTKTVHIKKLSDIQGEPQGLLKFITEAWIQIIECRRVLKWTYAYGYYVPKHEVAKKKLFEYLQGDAESWLEKLHQCAENDLRLFLIADGPSEKFNDFRKKLVELTNATRTYFENLVGGLENGLSEACSKNVVGGSKRKGTTREKELKSCKKQKSLILNEEMA